MGPRYGKPVIKDSIFEDNKAGWRWKSGQGGAIYIGGMAAVVQGNTFTNNSIWYSAEDDPDGLLKYGGAICVARLDHEPMPDIVSNVFSGNYPNDVWIGPDGD